MSCLLEMVVDGDSKGTFLQELTFHLDNHVISLSSKQRTGYVEIFIDGIKLNTSPVKWKYKTKGLLPDMISKFQQGVDFFFQSYSD